MSGHNTDTLTSVSGCDSIIDVLVTIFSSTLPSLEVKELPTLNIATGGTASASDTYSSNDPIDAFDGDYDILGWGSEGNGFPSWLEYDYGSGNGKIVKGYSFYCSSNMTGGWSGSDYDPSEWNFQVLMVLIG
ncbi:MAG: hypothetical protein IPG89_06710 [Bacteroidetes bacterium]|nr:hypothetical protein [Bacteroidota bacterium]